MRNGLECPHGAAASGWVGGLAHNSGHLPHAVFLPMARQPRLTLAGHPHHVIHRGNNRQAIVVDDVDRQRLLDELREHARGQGVAVHGYVLMDNHLHLLLTPESDTGIGLMMQALGRGYVRHFNRRHGRSGTLWEGRYRSALIQAERHLLACMVYIDLNPVRAGMVQQAEDYPWSSHGHCVGLRQDPLVTPHALYWALGNTPFAREQAYAGLVGAGTSQPQQDALRRSTQSGWVLGSESFIAQLARQTHRRVGPGRVGRPALPGASEEKN
jgi:putative transposase